MVVGALFFLLVSAGKTTLETLDLRGAHLDVLVVGDPELGQLGQ